MNDTQEVEGTDEGMVGADSDASFVDESIVTEEEVGAEVVEVVELTEEIGDDDVFDNYMVAKDEEAVPSAESPLVKSAVKCGDVVYFGGTDTTGRGFIAKQVPGSEQKVMALDGGCKSVEVIVIGGSAEDREVIFAALGNEDQLYILRCDADLAVKKTVIIADVVSPIIALAVWDDEIIISTLRHDPMLNYIVPSIIRLSPDMTTTQTIILTVAPPDGFGFISDPTTVAIGSSIVPDGDLMFVGGSAKNTINQAYSFVIAINKDNQAVNSCTFISDDVPYISLEAVTVEGSELKLLGVCSDVSGQPMNFSRRIERDTFKEIV